MLFVNCTVGVNSHVCALKCIISPLDAVDLAGRKSSKVGKGVNVAHHVLHGVACYQCVHPVWECQDMLLIGVRPARNITLNPHESSGLFRD